MVYRQEHVQQTAMQSVVIASSPYARLVKGVGECLPNNVPLLS